MKSRSSEAYAALRRGHTRLARVELWHPTGKVGDLPIEDGEVQYSLSTADGTRRGRVIVPGYDWFAKVEPGTGAWVRVSFTVDGETFDHGEFPILQAVARRPAGTVELLLGDWAERRDQPAEVTTTLGSTAVTVASVVATYMGHTTPGGKFTITADDSFGAKCATPVELQIGQSVWQALTELANQVGCVIRVTSRSTGELRRYDPNVPHHDDCDGVLIEEIGAVVADEAVNMVICQAEKSDPDTGTTVFRAVRTLTTGPYRYDSNGIGRRPLVEVLRLTEPTQALVDAEADRLFARRVGIVRSHEIRVVPMPWIEEGDIVAYRSTPWGGPVFGMVDEVTHPLTARGTMRIRLRDSQVMGRGGGEG